MAVYAVEINVPDELVEGFELALSGDDNDVLLAAENTINGTLDQMGVVFPRFLKVELDFIDRIG